MKIWRLDSTKPIKDITKTLKDITKPLKDESKKKSDDEEFTDISQSSTPAKNDKKKDKMEEIYSTKDKQVKYKRLTPLEAEAAAKRTKSAKEILASGKAEITLDTPQPENSNIELTSEFEEGTVIAEDIIEDAAPLSRYAHVEDIDDIDIDLDPIAAIKKYERQVNSTVRHEERQKPKLPKSDFERIFGKPKFDVTGEKVVAKIPTYQHESKINHISLKAGRFSDVVENEYNEYLQSNDPIISKRPDYSGKGIDQRQSLLYTLSQRALHKNAQEKPQKPVIELVKQEVVEEQPTQPKPKKSKIKKFFRIMKKLIFAKNIDQKPKEESDNHVLNYQEDQSAIEFSNEINTNYKILMTKAILLFIAFTFSLTLSVMEKTMGANMFNTQYSPLIYCGANLLILIGSGVLSRQNILNGIKPLKTLKGNSDTAAACAFCACALQQVIALFFSAQFVSGTMHLYTTIVTLALALNMLGRVFMVSRVKSNFRFITSKSPAYSARLFKSEDAARKMLSGTVASKNYVAYQHPTNFMSDFLKISYAPDPSEEFASKFAPITAMSSIVVCILYGIISKTVVGAFSALAVMCCISIPICALSAGNIPLKLFCKKTLKDNAMVSGYPSIKQFCDTSAVVVTAMDLYPRGCIDLKLTKNFVDYRVEESLLSAATVLKEAYSPLYHLFDKLLKKYAHSLPKVESFMYEDKLGLVGWVNGERVLVGNRALLDRYHIFVEDASLEAKYKNQGKDVTYIACSGQLISVLVTSYRPSKLMKEEIIKAEANGLCLLVTTTDSNITQEKVSSDYDLFYRSVKVLSTGFANDCTSACKQKTDTSRAYIATRGKTRSLIHAISGCVALKNNMTIGLIIEIFGLILGVLLSATLILYATVSILGVFEMLLYMLFWGIAAIGAQLIKKP